MLQTRKQTWTVIDIGSRWIKCARFAIKQGAVETIGTLKIDIQEEGLLSAEEIGEAIRKALGAVATERVALVLPADSAVSQVIDLPGFSAGDRSDQFEAEILDLIGLSRARCVYDSTPLKTFGGYAGPQWITVAKEESLGRRISPLLGQGLRVEAATTVGNALVAAFQHTHPQVSDACLVDIGATQTTLVRLQWGQPTQMTSIVDGGEKWVEALLEHRAEAFEEAEARLFRDDLFVAPEERPALRAAVDAWRSRVVGQIGEWSSDASLPGDDGTGDVEIYMFGGYSAVNGLLPVLNESGGASWHSWQPPESTPFLAGGTMPIWAPAYGAVLMAAGGSGLKASILPHSLDKMRRRRLSVGRLRMAVVYLFALLAVFLVGAIFQQRVRLKTLESANLQTRETLAEIEATAALLQQRDALAERIEPIVTGQLNSIHSLETFGRILRIQRDFGFNLIRFADRRTYFGEMDAQARGDAFGQTVPERIDQSSLRHTRAYVVELVVRGGQAERLQALGEIVGSLRQDNYFSNVDRLVGLQFSADTRKYLTGDDEAYALLLTLADEPFSLRRKDPGDE